MKLQVKFRIGSSPAIYSSTLDLVRTRTALLVVDMQNDFAHPEGMLGLYGNDMSGALEIIPRIKNLGDAFRLARRKVIYTLHTFRPDLSDQPKMFREITRRRMAIVAGSTRSKASPCQEPGDHSLESLTSDFRPRTSDFRKNHPFLIKDSWNASIVDHLAPQRKDILIDTKHNYDSFYQTDLEQILRDLKIENLIVTGIATNVCVETTIRSAYHRDIRCILVEDATWATSPDLIQNTLKVISANFGYLSSTSEVLKALFR